MEMRSGFLLRKSPNRRVPRLGNTAATEADTGKAPEKAGVEFTGEDDVHMQISTLGGVRYVADATGSKKRRRAKSQRGP
jgi:hypothetical protein